MPDIGTLLYTGSRITVGIDPVEEIRLEEFLGAGGFGQTWKVVDVATGIPYALKMIRLTDSADENVRPLRLVERVRLEASVSISSEHIVRALGLCDWDKETYLILFEFFSGRSLAELIEKRTLTDRQKWNVWRQILVGVQDAHRSNIIHRDLKPGNILVGDKDRVRVIDFGISKFRDADLTKTAGSFGTVQYMAPELLMIGSAVADARSDIYALGHVFYEMAVGEHAWSHAGWRDLKDFAEYLMTVPEPTEGIDLTDFTCDFCPDARRILSRMVRIDPDARYSAVAEILADLGAEEAAEEPQPLDDLHLRSPILVVESGSNRNARTVLGLDDTQSRTIGVADIAGDERSISRKHLEFLRSGSRYLVRDLGSKNGTLVRGIRLEPDPERRQAMTELHHGDRIKVGDVFLRFAFMPRGDIAK